MNDGWDVAAALAAVRARMRAACERVGRSPDGVQLLAVSKFHEPASIRRAHAAGQREFGENYVRELADKAQALGDLPALHWSLIGRLQRNKAKDVARIGCAVQTIDSSRLVEALANRAAEVGRVLDVFVQVNIAAEPQKAGASIAELPQLTAAVRGAPSLRLRGLMTIPKADADEAETRGYFRRMRALATELDVSELSMGMSDDFEIAIEEGATLVRIGTAIFGPRRG
ncbi:MAG TPA: YggS family pyridoxal phosphate-dependent enzyme [Polyangiales bacterium]